MWEASTAILIIFAITLGIGALSDLSKRKAEPETKVTSLTVNWDWLREQARGCSCTVCKKISGRR